jgi:hypothetical protein
MVLTFPVIMAPLTRARCPEHIPGENVVEYYRQRASDGGLIISEATHISVMVCYFYAMGLDHTLMLRFLGRQLYRRSRNLYTRAEASLEESHRCSAREGRLYHLPIMARMLNRLFLLGSHLANLCENRSVEQLIL